MQTQTLVFQTHKVYYRIGEALSQMERLLKIHGVDMDYDPDLLVDLQLLTPELIYKRFFGMDASYSTTSAEMILEAGGVAIERVRFVLERLMKILEPYIIPVITTYQNRAFIKFWLNGTQLTYEVTFPHAVPSHSTGNRLTRLA